MTVKWDHALAFDPRQSECIWLEWNLCHHHCKRDWAGGAVRKNVGLCIVLYCIVSYVFYITLQQADVRVWIEGGTGGVLYCIALHCIALHCIALHCIALHCIALHCIALYRIALYVFCITLQQAL